MFNNLINLINDIRVWAKSKIEKAVFLRDSPMTWTTWQRFQKREKMVADEFWTYRVPGRHHKKWEIIAHYFWIIYTEQFLASYNAKYTK